MISKEDLELVNIFMQAQAKHEGRIFTENVLAGIKAVLAAKTPHQPQSIPFMSGMNDRQVDVIWDKAIAACRSAVLAQGQEALEASKAKDAVTYKDGYQDACIDCDEAILELLRAKE